MIRNLYSVFKSKYILFIIKQNNNQSIKIFYRIVFNWYIYLLIGIIMNFLIFWLCYVKCKEILSFVLKLVVDSVTIPVLQVSVNGSLIQQTTNYQYTITGPNDLGKYDLTISNILIPSNQPYYFIFSLLFESKIVVNTGNVIMSLV